MEIYACQTQKYEKEHALFWRGDIDIRFGLSKMIFFFRTFSFWTTKILSCDQLVIHLSQSKDDGSFNKYC